MIVKNTDFPDLKIIEAFNPKDCRGQFVKVFNKSFFQYNDLQFDLKEVYYSVSRRNVIRGMHFQLPPDDHAKIVFVSYGMIKDVCIDLRKDSKKYLKVFSIDLDDKKNQAIYIPSGFAHGFKTISETAIVHYLQTSEYSAENDSGIKWNSIPYDWDIDNPITSQRDNCLMDLNDFINNKNIF